MTEIFSWMSLPQSPRVSSHNHYLLYYISAWLKSNPKADIFEINMFRSFPLKVKSCLLKMGKYSLNAILNQH